MIRTEEEVMRYKTFIALRLRKLPTCVCSVYYIKRDKEIRSHIMECTANLAVLRFINPEVTPSL